MQDEAEGRSSPPVEIQRPRSALHAGNFTDDIAQAEDLSQRVPLAPGPIPYTSAHGPFGSSPTTPWYTPSSSCHGRGGFAQTSFRERDYEDFDRRPSRSRAPSLHSYSSSSYVLKAPTTPLIQQSNNTDLDFSLRNRSISPEKSSRRHTMPPHTLNAMQSTLTGQMSSNTQSARQLASYRREGSFPYGHYPRRSLTSNWSLQAATSPSQRTPASLRSRKTSFSDPSPLQHASMVGSYEESILHGRMSTAPSMPLPFTAEIGVIGKGDCKPKCPAHVTISFPAVYYSYSSGDGRSTIHDEPSPYVGLVDLEHSLPSPEEKSRRTRSNKTVETDRVKESKVEANGLERETKAADDGYSQPKQRRRKSPENPPPGGSYRIPKHGQLQIIIKSPNNTAVKVFLVQYDLTAMEAGTKTFVRQRCYSAGPILHSPSASGSAHIPGSLPGAGRSTLRYLINLNICSTSKGRFYLYRNIRVVFANRVPDDKEQLTNEIEVPQPKYSAYRPRRSSNSGQGSVAGAQLAADKASRRRNAGFNFGMDDTKSYLPQPFLGGSTFPYTKTTELTPIPPVPYNLTTSRRRPDPGQERSTDSDAMEIDTSRPTTSSEMQSPPAENPNSFSPVQLSSSYLSNSSQSGGPNAYGKLSKGESGYGYVCVRPCTPEPGEGLLARRLKGLGVLRDESGG